MRQLAYVLPSRSWGRTYAYLIGIAEASTYHTPEFDASLDDMVNGTAWFPSANISRRSLVRSLKALERLHLIRRTNNGPKATHYVLQVLPTDHFEDLVFAIRRVVAHGLQRLFTTGLQEASVPESFWSDVAPVFAGQTLLCRDLVRVDPAQLDLFETEPADAYQCQRGTSSATSANLAPVEKRCHGGTGQARTGAKLATLSTPTGLSSVYGGQEGVGFASAGDDPGFADEGGEMQRRPKHVVEAEREAKRQRKAKEIAEIQAAVAGGGPLPDLDVGNASTGGPNGNEHKTVEGGVTKAKRRPKKASITTRRIDDITDGRLLFETLLELFPDEISEREDGTVQHDEQVKEPAQMFGWVADGMKRQGLGWMPVSAADLVHCLQSFRLYERKLTTGVDPYRETQSALYWVAWRTSRRSGQSRIIGSEIPRVIAGVCLKAIRAAADGKAVMGGEKIADWKRIWRLQNWKPYAVAYDQAVFDGLAPEDPYEFLESLPDHFLRGATQERMQALLGDKGNATNKASEDLAERLRRSWGIS